MKTTYSGSQVRPTVGFILGVSEVSIRRVRSEAKQREVFPNERGKRKKDFFPSGAPWYRASKMELISPLSSALLHPPKNWT
ncbi:hypothetical protein HMPREF1556_01663 [Porphyromonas sp. oral taxon 278 str. W7784]|nr:hypothetical protein HMPREF1556_01663 [Porphyromonas sp. oral taxon 278 str. W7784]